MAFAAICLFFVQCIIIVYTIITLPIYFIFQKPWKRWQLEKTVWAHFSDPKDLYSPILRNKHRYPNTIEIQSVDQLFRKSISRNTNKECLGRREIIAEAMEYEVGGKSCKKLRLGNYHWLTYIEVEEKVESLSRGFLNIGFTPKQQIMILAETRLEWFLALQACFRINVPVATLSAASNEDGFIHGINETEVTTIIISQGLLPKLENIIDSVHNVRQVIIMEDLRPMKLKKFPERVVCYKFSAVESMGIMTEYISKPNPPTKNDVAAILYTSGSTNLPKGKFVVFKNGKFYKRKEKLLSSIKFDHSVVLTHKNLISTIFSFKDALTSSIDKSGGRYIAFLPLAHIFEMLIENLILLMDGSIGYSSPLTLTDKAPAIMEGCQGDATVLQPNIIISVPLMLDKIRKNIAEELSVKGDFSKRLFDFSIRYKKYWDSKGYNTPLLNRFVFHDVKKLLGGKVNIVLSGAAPLSADTGQFMKTCLNVRLVQAYGLTETAGSATIMSIDDRSIGTVGPPSSGVQLKLVDWKEGDYKVRDKPNPRGEIVVGGDPVSSGYFKNETLTKEEFKVVGGTRWFYTGDIGEFCSNGTIKIIDRKKDMVKLLGDEFVSLGKIESEMKTCPLVDNICVLTSPLCSYLIAMVVPNQRKLHMLADGIVDNKFMKFFELCQCPKIIETVTEQLTEHAKKCHLSKAETPQKYHLCREEWLPETGLVTAAMKIRRKFVEQYYKSKILELFGTESQDKGSIG